ncbi:MAG TPA: YciI family protein [Micromonosporaceae bacterium]|jgi:hypothetical protein
MEFDSFTVVLLVLRDDAPTFTEDEGAVLQDAHLSFLADLHEDGKLLAAGPVRDPDSRVRGISLLNVGAEEAMRLKSQDPAVQAGLYRLVALPWMTPAGALHFTPTRVPRSIADVME